MAKLNSMTYINNPELESMSLFLTEREIGSSIINGKLSLYNVSTQKMPVLLECDENITDDFNFGNSQNSQQQQQQPEQPEKRKPRSSSLELFPNRPKNAKRSSSLGDLSEPSSKKLFYDLITTLNQSYPDHDFFATKLEQFIEKDVTQVMRHVNTTLAELTIVNNNILEKLWHSIDHVIHLKKCEVFSYVTDHEVYSMI